MNNQRQSSTVQPPVPATRTGGWSPHYLPFALFNAVYSGIGGLVIARLAGDARLAGIAWASFYLGTAVASIAWGNLATRLGRKPVLVIGLVVGMISMGSVAMARGPLLPLATALLGVGGAAVQLTAVLLVRAWYPQPRWDEQIGTLQTWMGVGQVAGLLLITLAGPASHAAWLGAVLLGAALCVTLPLTDPRGSPPPPRESRHHIDLYRLESAAITHIFHLAHLRRADLRIPFSRPLPILLTRWGVLMFASIPVATLIPLLLRDSFGMRPGVVALGLAAVGVCGVLGYGPASRRCHRVGAERVLRSGGLLRAVGIFTLALEAWGHGPAWSALVSFGIITAAWPPLSVASVIRVGQVVPPEHESTALGLYNAVASGARVIGSLAGGALVPLIGYPAMLLLCGVLMLVIALVPPPRSEKVFATVGTITRPGDDLHSLPVSPSRRLFFPSPNDPISSVLARCRARMWLITASG